MSGVGQIFCSCRHHLFLFVPFFHKTFHFFFFWVIFDAVVNLADVFYSSILFSFAYFFSPFFTSLCLTLAFTDLYFHNYIYISVLCSVYRSYLILVAVMLPSHPFPFVLFTIVEPFKSQQTFPPFINQPSTIIQNASFDFDRYKACLFLPHRQEFPSPLCTPVVSLKTLLFYLHVTIWQHSQKTWNERSLIRRFPL